MPNTCSEECQARNFGLNHEKPGLFVQPQCGPQCLYVLWLIFWLLYHLTILGVDVYLEYDDRGYHSAHWLKFLTNWSYMLLTLMILVDLLTVIHALCNHKQLLDKDIPDYEISMPWYLKLSWLLFNISSTAAVMISFFYWLYWYTLDEDWLEFRDVAFHAGNVGFSLLHLLGTAKPMRFLHFYQPVIYLLLYNIFSIIYHFVSDGDSIYPVLDWDDLEMSLLPTSILIFVGTPIAFWLLWIIVKLRIYTSSKCCGNDWWRSSKVGDQNQGKWGGWKPQAEVQGHPPPRGPPPSYRSGDKRHAVNF